MSATVTIQRHLTIKPFLKQADSHDTALQWQRYKKEIDRQFRFFGITDPNTKKDGLLIYGGQDLVDVDEALPDPTEQEGDDAYKILIRKIDTHFMPKKNKDFARFQFNELKQSTSERLADYYARVRETAKKCEYNDHETEAIRDHLIRTMLNHKIRSRAIRDNWELDRILTEAALDEQTAEQAGTISKKINEDNSKERVKKLSKTQFGNRSHQGPCGRCGNPKEHQNCPAIGVTCNNCGKKNHFARVCLGKTKPTPETYTRRQFQPRPKPRYESNSREQTKPNTRGKRDDSRISQFPKAPIPRSKHLEFIQCNDDISSDEEYFINHLKTHHTSQSDSWKTCTIQINGISTEVEPDSGSDTNIMDEIQFKSLQQQAPEITLNATNVKLKTLTEELPVTGAATVEMSNQTHTVRAKLIVIKGKIDSPPLIGRKTLEALGMLLIDETGGLKNLNKIKSLRRENPQEADQNNTELENILAKYQTRFTGIGQAKRDGKEIRIKIPMKPNTTPIAQKPRRVPYHLVEPLKKRLKEFENDDIVEPVPQHEAITWCSPLVVQPKPKNPQDIRACLDLRLVNQSMLRTRQVQAPITEDFIREFKGCKVFSKLDLNHGYHQFSLDDESRKIMTFSTPWGNYRYKRLAFGGLNSQDLFDAEIAKIISGIPRVLNNRDDIMIAGVDWNDHNANLRAVLQRIEDHNLTLRQEKCEFGKSTMNFHGHLFTAEGLEPSPDKIRAIQKCTPPTTKEELISFLQMLAYLSRYIINFSSRCEPLRQLTRNNTKFHWTDAHQTAFDDLKKAITSAPVLIPYYPDRDTLIICDGSPTGLGGGLFQKTQHGYQPVHYVSRTLTDTESRYSQIEREALAIEFTTSRLQMYLVGSKHFKIATDHKPLLPLFNNPQAKLPPRIERIIMKMQNLDFTMMHIPGKENATDYLSRHPLPDNISPRTDSHVKAITRTDHAVVLERIAAETQTDPELQQLKQAMQTGAWDKKDPVLKPYYDVQAELYESEDILLRLDKIIPPENLRAKIVRIAHKQGHLGLSKTKEMIRQKYWWPNMNLQIEETTKKCFECQISTNTHHVEPAKMTTLPARPWTTIEVDFCGPFPDGKYALVVTDQYSRYPEVEFTTTTSFEVTRKKLKKIFSTHGVPEILQSDNGPPFNSQAFAEFAEESGFKHRRITPLHPKAQGQVENFNKLINKTITISRHNHTDPEEAIYDMLQAYRSTPHPGTNETPYKLLMNRDVRTKLDHFPTETSLHDKEVRDQDFQYKGQRKIYHDKRYKAKIHRLKQGDAVVVKRENKRKGQTPYEPYVSIITETKGSQIIAKREKDDRIIRRDASKFKLLRTAGNQVEITSPPDNETESLLDRTENFTTTEPTVEPEKDFTPQHKSPEPIEPQPRRSERLKNKRQRDGHGPN